jgi:shikimate kinase
MKIYLIGYMASGKTNLGREMAEISGMGFADLDELFEERYKISILEFFGKYGEDPFRKLERGILLETISMDNAVISTGGGTPCFFENMKFIKEHGRSVYLKMTVPQLAGRLSGIRKKRPLLKDIPHHEMEDHIVKQVGEREHFYLQADLVEEGPPFDAKEILRKLQ